MPDSLLFRTGYNNYSAPDTGRLLVEGISEPDWNIIIILCPDGYMQSDQKLHLEGFFNSPSRGYFILILLLYGGVCLHWKSPTTVPC